MSQPGRCRKPNYFLGNVPLDKQSQNVVVAERFSATCGFVGLATNGGQAADNSIAIWKDGNQLSGSNAFVDPNTGEIQTPSLLLNGTSQLQAPAGAPFSTWVLPDSAAANPGDVLTVDTVSPGPVITTSWQPPSGGTALNNGNIVYVKQTLPVVAPYEYSTIQAALTYVAGQAPSAVNPWQIFIYPGVYPETNLVVPSFVNVSGVSQGAVIVQGTAASASHVFTLQDQSALYNLTIQGPTQAGFAGIFVGLADFAVQLFVVTVNQCDIGILLRNGNGGNVFLYANDCALSDCITRALVADSTFAALETVNFYGFSTSYFAADSNPIALLVEAKGPTTVINSLSEQTERDPPVGPLHGTFMEISQGAVVHVSGLALLYFDTGFFLPNDGSVSTFTADGVDFFSCNININNQNLLSVGYFAGETEFLKTIYPLNGAWYISNKNPRILTVGNNDGSDFTDVASAMAVITGSGPNNRFIIQVAPGVFPIPLTILMKPFVSIVGVSQQNTILQAVANTTMIEMIPSASLANLTMRGMIPGSTHTAVLFNTGSNPTQAMTINGVIFMDHWQSISITNPALPVNILLTQCLFADTVDVQTCIDIQANNQVNLTLQNCLAASPQAVANPPPFPYFLRSRSAGALNPPIYISVANSRLERSVNGAVQLGTAFEIEAGNFSCQALACISFDTAISVPATIQTPRLRITNLVCDLCTKDLDLQSNLAVATVAGNLARSKVFVVSPNCSVAYIDPASGITISGQLFQGPSNAETTNITQQIQQGSQLGLISGGDFTILGNVLTVSAGEGYIMQGVFPNDWLHYLQWVLQGGIILPALQLSYIYVGLPGTVTLNVAVPNLTQNVLLGAILTDAGGIPIWIQVVPKSAVHLATSINSMLDIALGPVFAGGCIVTNTGTQLAMTAGQYYLGNLQFNPVAKALADPFTTFYQGGPLLGWNFVNGVTNVPNQWDNVGTLTAIAPGNFVKHLFYVTGDTLQYGLVYGQQQFASPAAAATGPLPTSPPFCTNNTVTVASIVVDSTGTITQILDERPSLSFRSGALSSTSNHSSLINLAADDHKQYLLCDGTRAMAGNLDMGTNNVFNAGTYNGVTVEAHASRHNPGGADALAIGVPVTIATANNLGVAASYALSDHVHAHGSQTDPTLHAIATPLLNGFMSAADKTILDNATPLDSISTIIERSATGTFESRAHTLFDTTGAQGVTLAAALATTPYTLTFPPNDGSANQVLVTDGTGVTTWTAITPGIITGVLPIANGGTNSGTALLNDRIMESKGGAIVERAAMLDGELIIGDTGGNPVNATLTPGSAMSITNAAGSITVDLANTAVVPGSYTATNLTVDAKGRITAATNGVAGTVTSVGTGTGLTGGPITSSGSISLANTAVTAGSYIATNLTVDAQGRITAAANGPAGTVTSVGSGTGLTGGPITGSGSLSLANTAVVPGSYTATNLTVDAQGRITAAANGVAGTVTSITAGNNLSGGVITGSGTIGILAPVSVANGGTGSITALNNDRIMESKGGVIVERAALTNGQIIIGSTGANPVNASLTAGTGISIVPGAGAITINNTTGGTVTSVGSGTGLTGGPITGSGSLSLANTAVAPGSYVATNLTVDAQGRITAAANGPVGTVTSVGTGTGLTGGPITASGSISLANTAVAPGTYTNSTITVDAQGRLTSASNGAVIPSLPTTVYLQEDFLQAVASGGSGSTYTADTNWTYTNPGGGNISTATYVNTDNEVGVIIMNSSAAASGTAMLSKNSRSFTTGRGATTMTCRVKVSAITNDVNSKFSFGFLGQQTMYFSPAIPALGGVFVTIHGNAANWVLETSNGAVVSSLVGPAFVLNTWVTLQLDINASGTSASFSVNGVAGGSTGATMPPTGNQLYWYLGVARGVGTGTVANVDYVSVQQTLTTSR